MCRASGMTCYVEVGLVMPNLLRLVLSLIEFSNANIRRQSNIG